MSHYNVNAGIPSPPGRRSARTHYRTSPCSTYWPKVSHRGSLSPRGDWRAPSDGNAADCSRTSSAGMALTLGAAPPAPPQTTVTEDEPAPPLALVEAKRSGFLRGSHAVSASLRRGTTGVGYAARACPRCWADDPSHGSCDRGPLLRRVITPRN